MDSISNIFATFAPYEKKNVSTDSVLAKSDYNKIALQCGSSWLNFLSSINRRYF